VLSFLIYIIAAGRVRGQEETSFTRQDTGANHSKLQHSIIYSLSQIYKLGKF